MGLLMLTTIRRQVNARDRRTIPWVHARLIKEVNGSKMPDGESPERRAEKREDRVGALSICYTIRALTKIIAQKIFLLQHGAFWFL